MLGISKADIWPGDGGFYTICLEILNDVSGDAIRFRQSFDYMDIRETLSRFQLCDRLTTQHNTHNSVYLGGAGVTNSECVAALNSPLSYDTAEWNNWSGRHCGSWRSIGEDGTVGSPDTDHALWNTAVPSGAYQRQSVTFLTRPGTCCDDGWNESGGTVSKEAIHESVEYCVCVHYTQSMVCMTCTDYVLYNVFCSFYLQSMQEVVVWGWDPKDPSDHGGYQGSHAGYPFTSLSSADCIVWLTGEEAFLECIKTVGSTKKRTSAGFWGFGQWRVRSSTQFCEANLPPSIFRGRLLVPLENELENNH